MATLDHVVIDSILKESALVKSEATEVLEKCKQSRRVLLDLQHTIKSFIGPVCSLCAYNEDNKCILNLRTNGDRSCLLPNSLPESNGEC